MFKNLNEKDKKTIYSLISLSAACAIVLIALSSIPGDKKDDKEAMASQDGNTKVENQEVKSDGLEGQLEAILSKIEGAGEVDAMITFESSEAIEPAFNENSTTEKTQEKDAQGGERTITTSSENKTMITSSSDGPVVIKTTGAQIKGVIVVASGASDPTVKETLYSAVQTALQVSGHQVEIYAK